MPAGLRTSGKTIISLYMLDESYRWQRYPASTDDAQCYRIVRLLVIVNDQKEINVGIDVKHGKDFKGGFKLVGAMSSIVGLHMQGSG